MYKKSRRRLPWDSGARCSKLVRASVARPGHPRICGRKKSPEGVELLLLLLYYKNQGFTRLGTTNKAIA
jgi:hypothetical protein